MISLIDHIDYLSEKYGFDGPYEMISLKKESTGVDGILVIITKLRNLSPVVDYYLSINDIENNKPCFRVSIETLKLVHEWENVNRGIIDNVFSFVRRNQRKLMLFWNKGQYWLVTQLIEFVDSLSVNDECDVFILNSDKTGIFGKIRIFTKHNGIPYCEYFQENDSFKISILKESTIVEQPKYNETSEYIPLVKSFIDLNHNRLLKFWHNARKWDQEYIFKFVSRLKKIKADSRNLMLG